MAKERDYRISFPATMYFSITAKTKLQAIKKAKAFIKEFIDSDGADIEMFTVEDDVFNTRVYANKLGEVTIEDVYDPKNV